MQWIYWMVKNRTIAHVDDCFIIDTLPIYHVILTLSVTLNRCRRTLHLILSCSHLYLSPSVNYLILTPKKSCDNEKRISESYA